MREPVLSGVGLDKGICVVKVEGEGGSTGELITWSRGAGRETRVKCGRHSGVRVLCRLSALTTEGLRKRTEKTGTLEMNGYGDADAMRCEMAGAVLIWRWSRWRVWV